MSNNVLGFFWFFTICFLAVLSMSKKLQEVISKILKWFFTAAIYLVIFLISAWLIGSAIDGANKKVFNFETGCGRYASRFSCDYVEKQATYEVFYWKDVAKDNPNDEIFVGMATGLSQCRDTAIYAHRDEMERRKRNWNNWTDSNDNWTERSYICVLTKDGRRLEKHRW